MRPWGSPLAYKGKMCTFENARNPGGHLEIWDISFEEVWALIVSANCFSIPYSTIFDYKIILKFQLIITPPPIPQIHEYQKFLALPPKESPQYQEGNIQVHFRVVMGDDDQ